MGKGKGVIMRKVSVKKLAETFGFKNVIISYHKTEGWWLESDHIDGFICIDSSGINKGLKHLFDNYHRGLGNTKMFGK